MHFDFSSYQSSLSEIKPTEASSDGSTISSEELAEREIDVVTFGSKDMSIVHEPMKKVDLTKYMENQKVQLSDSKESLDSFATSSEDGIQKDHQTTVISFFRWIGSRMLLIVRSKVTVRDLMLMNHCKIHFNFIMYQNTMTVELGRGGVDIGPSTSSDSGLGLSRVPESINEHASTLPSHESRRRRVEADADESDGGQRKMKKQKERKETKKREEANAKARKEKEEKAEVRKEKEESMRTRKKEESRERDQMKTCSLTKESMKTSPKAMETGKAGKKMDGAKMWKEKQEGEKSQRQKKMKEKESEEEKKGKIEKSKNEREKEKRAKERVKVEKVTMEKEKMEKQKMVKDKKLNERNEKPMKKVAEEKEMKEREKTEKKRGKGTMKTEKEAEAKDDGDEEKQKKVKRVRKPGDCPICKKTFQNVCHIKRHIALKHQKLRPFPCEEDSCDYSAGTLSDLNKHKDVMHNRMKQVKRIAERERAKRAMLPD